MSAPAATNGDAHDAEPPPAKRPRVESAPQPATAALHLEPAPAAAADAPPLLPPLPPRGHRLSLPEGWLSCPPHGSLVANLLLPCKVPLGARFDEVLCGPRAGARWGPRDAVAAASSGGRTVLAVVDLTKTKRYYSDKELPVGVRHFKLPCDGASGPPSPLDATVFCAFVATELDRWRAATADTPPLQRKLPAIVVHCTHGFNRTGAMLVHFLMRRDRGWPDLPSALNDVATARWPGIYKESYIESLFKYYREARPAPPTCVCPGTPPWKREGEDGPPPMRDEDIPPGDLWGLDNPSYVSSGAAVPFPIPDERPPVAAVGSSSALDMKHDDVLGEEVPPGLAASIRSALAQLTAPSQAAGAAAVAAASSWHEGGAAAFPGSQPVSLSRANAHLLADPSLRYAVSWKADGTRYLCLLLSCAAYLVDRSGRVRRCQMRFPTADKPVAGKAHRRAHTHHYTLLDGEMVIDRPPAGGGPPVRRFLVYDCCALNGVLLTDRTFKERNDAAEAAVLAPKKEYEAAAGARYLAACEEFRLRRKPFWGVEATPQLLRSTLPALPHPADGLIFQPGAEGYRVRTHDKLLKWKFPHLNSVDFILQLSRDGGGGHAGEPTWELHVMEQGGRTKPLRSVALPPDLTPPAGAHDPLTAPFVDDSAEPGEAEQIATGVVAECVWDGTRGCWSLLRVRRDKATANHESVFVSVWRSIADDMREEDVLACLRPAIEQRAARAAGAAGGGGGARPAMGWGGGAPQPQADRGAKGGAAAVAEKPAAAVLSAVDPSAI